MSWVFRAKSNSMCSRLPEPPESPKYSASPAGSTFASARKMHSPLRQDRCSRRSVSSSKSLGPAGSSGLVCSMMNGAASIRNPATPSCAQKPMIFLISARTYGWLVFRSGSKS